MKKFLITLFSILTVLAAIFAYILYTEGYFDTVQDAPQGELKPFEMKCEAGKCSAGKCGGKK